MNQQTRYDEAAAFVCAPLRASLLAVEARWKEAVHEIRLRAGQPVILTHNGGSLFVAPDGGLRDRARGGELLCSYECLEQTFRAVCGYSVHTHQHEIARGYISLKGGHRAGLGGTAVEREGRVVAMKEISSLNIRVARQVFGAADPLLPATARGGVLIVGRPGSGKTTLLRDLCRQLSGGIDRAGRKIVLLDERGELAAMWDGLAQNDVGINTDVLNGFSKATAMEMAVRSLSPDVVICDEIGSQREAEGLLGCVNAGVEVMASVHADNMAELWRKPWVVRLLRAGVFRTVALLGGSAETQRNIVFYETDAWLHEMAGSDAAGGSDEYLGDSPGQTL